MYIISMGHDGTRRDGRIKYQFFSKKYIDGLHPKTDTHRHFRPSKQISEPVRIVYENICFIYIIFVIYIYILLYI